MKLVVVGAGAAGVAAAFAASAFGAEVRLLHDHVGATELYTGVVDFAPWTAPRERVPLETLERFNAALGLWCLAEETLVATASGVVRPAAGRDRALLELAPLAGKLVAIPTLERDDWDSGLLLRALSESAWTRATGTRFECVDVALLQNGYERRISAHDFAVLHNQPARWRFLCDRLKNASAPDAWLCGPWLGTEPGIAAAISSELGVEVGEVTSLPGGPAGARFTVARDRLLGELRVDVRRARVLEVRRRGRRWEIYLGGGEMLHADAVLLAIGGVSGGGIVLPLAAEQATRASFDLSLSAPVELMLHQRPIDTISSSHGLDFSAHGLTLLEKVGAKPMPASEGLMVAGDVSATHANTVLKAVMDGLSAASALCS